MKSTRFLLSLAAACLVAASAFVGEAVRTVGAMVARGVDRMLVAFAVPASGDPVVVDKPQRVLQASKAFYARMVKRERPAVQGSWRMCPSC